MTDRLDAWVQVLAEGLGLSADEIDRDLLLDLAKDAAHQIDRPAAPLTTYIVGVAAARAGGGQAAVAQAANRTRDLIRGWSDDGSAAPTD